jgi:hypothetical protein
MTDKQRKEPKTIKHLEAIAHLIEMWHEECREGQVLSFSIDGYMITVQPDEEKALSDEDTRKLTAMAQEFAAAHQDLVRAMKFIEEHKIPASMVRETFLEAGATEELIEEVLRILSLTAEGFTFDQAEEIIRKEEEER